MTSGARIATAARGWLGTRFHHQGRLKSNGFHKGGVDCLGLLIGIAKELDLKLPDGRYFADFDEVDYSHYPDTVHLQAQLLKVLQPISLHSIQPGDVVLMCVDNNPQHLGIVGEAQGKHTLIHAYAPARAVVEHGLDGWWQERIIAAYRSY